MGIRISKCMGFYLPKENIPQIFDEEKLSSLLEEEPSYPFEQFKQKMLAHDDSIISKIVLNSYSGKNIELIDYIMNVYNYDTFEGILFQSIETKKHKRYNDLIDYHEHLERYGHHTFNVQRIFEDPNQFPESYLYKGKDCEKLKYNHKFSSLKDLSKNYPDYFSKENPLKSFIEDKIIELDIDNESWAFAQLTGCLKKDITAFQFNSLIYPAIITSWG